MKFGLKGDEMTRCFCCGKFLETESTWEKNHTILTPLYGGLWFRANGNYGSTIHDPIPGQKDSRGFLQIAVCDRCVVAKSTQGTVSHVFDIRHSVVSKMESFIPDFDDNE